MRSRRSRTGRTGSHITMNATQTTTWPLTKRGGASRGEQAPPLPQVIGGNQICDTREQAPVAASVARGIRPKPGL